MSFVDRAQQQSETTVLPFRLPSHSSEQTAKPASTDNPLRDLCTQRDKIEEKAVLYTAASAFMLACGAALVIPGYEPIVTHQQHAQREMNILIGSASLILGTICGIEAHHVWVEFKKACANLTGHKNAAKNQPAAAVNTPMQRASGSTLELHS